MPSRHLAEGDSSLKKIVDAWPFIDCDLLPSHTVQRRIWG